MTSTEFAAKYRLLKNVATRGARSFLAQQVELGRMVMVHYLDAEPAAERGDAVARLEGLSRPARDKLLEIVNVDGSPVAVTLFISSFVDFSTWLDQVAGPSASAPVASTSGDFTWEFSRMGAARPADLPLPPSPENTEPSGPHAPVADTSRPDVTAPRAPITRAPGPVADSMRDDARGAPAASAEVVRTDSPDTPSAHKPSHGGEFTQFFGRLSGPGEDFAPASAEAAPPKPGIPPSTRDLSADSPTLIIEVVKPPVADFGKPFVAPPTAPALSAPTFSAPLPAQSAPVDATPAVPLAPSAAAPITPTAPVERKEPDEASFTAIFGASAFRAGQSTPSNQVPPLPSFAAPSPAGRVMPFPTADSARPVPPPPAPPPAAPAGEFTQLFQRLNTAGAAPPTSKAADVPRPLDSAFGTADISIAPPAPRFGSETPRPAAPVVPPLLPNSGSVMAPTSLPNVPTIGGGAPPPGSAWGAPTMADDGAPSDFTRILGRVSPPGQASPAAAPSTPAPAPAITAAPGGEPRGLKTYLPLILALNAVVVATIAIVLYFVLKK